MIKQVWQCECGKTYGEEIDALRCCVKHSQATSASRIANLWASSDGIEWSKMISVVLVDPMNPWEVEFVSDGERLRAHVRGADFPIVAVRFRVFVS